MSKSMLAAALVAVMGTAASDTTITKGHRAEAGDAPGRYRHRHGLTEAASRRS
jgi:hypothetical protein